MATVIVDIVYNVVEYSQYIKNLRKHNFICFYLISSN